MFLVNLSRVLAHTVVYEARSCVALFACADPPSQNAQESTGDMLKAYIENLPQLMKTTGENILPYEQANLDASKVISPQQNALQLALAKEFLPQFTELGSKITGQAQEGQAANDLALLKGTGKDLTAAALEAQKQADQPYYTSRDATAAALGKLMGSLDDPNSGLSGSERAEVDRTLAQGNEAAGRTGVGTSLGTVQNAMTSGAAGAQRKMQKQAAISSAVQSASQFLPTAKSGIDVAQLTLNRPMFNNPATGQYSGQAQTGTATQQLGTNLFNQIGENQRTAMGINAQRRDPLDRFIQIQDSTSSALGNICCWTFMEAYEGTQIPWFVRAVRDSVATPNIREGYRRFSKLVVPLMKRSAWIRSLIVNWCVSPLTAHAGYVSAIPGYEYGRMYHRRRGFWLNVWNILGKI